MSLTYNVSFSLMRLEVAQFARGDIPAKFVQSYNAVTIYPSDSKF